MEGASKESLDALAAKVDATAASLGDAVQANEKQCTSEIDKLKADLKEQKEEADKAAASEVEVASSWQFMANAIHPTNQREAVSIVVSFRFK